MSRYNIHYESKAQFQKIIIKPSFISYGCNFADHLSVMFFLKLCFDLFSDLSMTLNIFRRKIQRPIHFVVVG